MREIAERIAVEAYARNFKSGPLWTEAPQDVRNRYKVWAYEWLDIAEKCGYKVVMAGAK